METEEETLAGLPILLFRDATAWEAWLESNHGENRGLWLRIARKGAAEASLSYAEALEVALCYGWIDGLRKALDQTFFVQKFTPRGRKSVWSKINREKALALIANGRMKEAGRRAIELAREDGRWDAAYDSPSNATVPADLQAALDASPAAAAKFAALSRQDRYAILFRTQTARRPETRAARIAKFIAMLERGETFHPQP